MITPPALLPSKKILVGMISLDTADSRELLSWAIRVLARPHDTIVATHIVVSEDSSKKNAPTKRRESHSQSQICKSKAHVISVLGEFSRTCQSMQVNLEARVGLSARFSRGLIEEVKSISADYLVLHGHRNQSVRTWREVVRYCFEHAPQTCTVVSVGTTQQFKTKSGSSDSESTKEINGWLNEDNHSDASSSINVEKNSLVKEAKSKSPSPRIVLDELERGSQSTEDDTLSSTGDSSTSESPSLALPPPHFQSREKARKQVSAYKLISSLFSSPLLKKRKESSFSNKEKQQQQHKLLNCFSYDELANATNNFHPGNVVGRGGYSEVYRGDLADRRRIAVKRLAKDNKDPTKEKEFLMELGIISHVSHPNTAKLVGCCIENGLYLIFDFSQNGNLASALHGKEGEPLEWAVRYKIALGVARGLHYLHKCCKHRIIHRDIKASNVLLGPDYEPQITDFGLAKWLPNKWTHHAVILTEGTFGYMAPEYFIHGIVDEKTDVFAFGVLLLEIISGRRPVDSSKQNLLLWAKPLMESGNITELADPKLEGKFDADEMYRVVLTASYCVTQSAVWRPSMSEALELLTSEQREPEVGRSGRSIPKFTSDELDDYSMIFGYEVPVSSTDLEDFL